MRNSFVKLKKESKKRNPSSNKWLLRHVNDHFVKMSKAAGYRSRSAYKLIEIDDKFKILKPNIAVLDLGAAPGGWSQIVAERINIGNARNKIVALDLLEIKPINGVVTLQQDFYDANLPQILQDTIKTRKVNIILSDMSANTTGIRDVDYSRILDLCEHVFNLAKQILRQDGSVVCKIFQGGTEQALLNEIKKNFRTVKHFKPKSSRPESKEMYVVAMGFKPQSTDKIDEKT